MIQGDPDLAGKGNQRSREQAERQREKHGSGRLMSSADIGRGKGNDHEKAGRDAASDRPIDRPDDKRGAKPQYRQLSLHRVAVYDRMDGT